MSNPYHDESLSWELYEAGERLESEAKHPDESINAADRRTAALYKIGAALTRALDSDYTHTAHSISEDICLGMSRMDDAISEVAEAIKSSGTEPKSDV